MSTLKTRNAKFKKASKAQKRVLIAEDVLAQMDAKKFRPKFGRFIQLKGKFDPTAQLSSLLEDNAPKVNCTACALGSMMMSEIRHTNSVEVGAMSKDPDDDIRDAFRGSKTDRLDAYFNKDQLKSIEIAFERGNGYYGGYGAEEADLWPHLKTPSKRMRAIMENIVANNGMFKP